MNITAAEPKPIKAANSLYKALAVRELGGAVGAVRCLRETAWWVLFQEAKIPISVFNCMKDRNHRAMILRYVSDYSTTASVQHR
jgi:hypothetical protein